MPRLAAVVPDRGDEVPVCVRVRLDRRRAGVRYSCRAERGRDEPEEGHKRRL
jgi:hypothetical protein